MSRRTVYIVYIGSELHASEVPQTKAIVSIENVVASASINQRVDLNLITRNFVDVEYHPDQFPGLVFRLKSPKTATLDLQLGEDGLHRREIGGAVKEGRGRSRQEVEEGGHPHQERGGDDDTEHGGIGEPRGEDSPGGSGQEATKIDVRARAVPRTDPQDGGPQDRDTPVLLREGR